MSTPASLPGGRPARVARDAIAWAAIVALALPWAARKLAMIGLPDPILAHFCIGDDAFYYLEIAFRWAHGEGSTFDGIHPTNGYQPLWEWVLAAFARLFEERSSFLAAVQHVAIGLHLVLVLALAGVARALAGRVASVAVALLALHASPSLSQWCLALETSIYAPLLVLCYVAWRARERWPGHDPGFAYAAFGTLVALTVLARIEAVLLFALLEVALVVQVATGRLAPRALVAFSLAAAAPLALYGLGNLVVYGDPRPVSVVVKSDAGAFAFPAFAKNIAWLLDRNGPIGILPEWLLERRPFVDALRAAVDLGILVVAPLLLVVRAARREGPEGTVLGRLATAPSVPFLLYGLGHFLVIFSDSAGGAHFHHAVPEYLALALMPGVALGRLLARAQRAPHRGPWRALAAVTLSAVAVCGVLRTADHLERLVVSEDMLAPTGETLAADWVNAQLPPGSVIGSWDSGYFGWAIDAPVVNLDGLVNDLDYARTYLFEVQPISRYVHATGITHLLSQGDPDQPFARGMPADELEELRRWEWQPGWTVVLRRVLPPHR